ncbi:MAG: serine/threonine-protein phosphatase, partial [Oscillospiraceae bacterium]|nr:serine/threonine-protein phosphatase [Oscillospiraceae bacterium]
MMVYSRTDIGNKRAENQDSFRTAELENAVFAVVCDGMGGQNAGKEAGERTSTLVTEQIEGRYSPDLDSNRIRNMLMSAVRSANAVVYELGCAIPEWNGMGTTCVAVLIRDNVLHVINVGDSRAYLITHQITQITKDHSMVMDLYESGDITKAELKTHPKRNIITRAIGVSEDVEPDYFEYEIPDGAAVLLCSDGLYNFCDEGQMFRCIKDMA